MKTKGKWLFAGLGLVAVVTIAVVVVWLWPEPEVVLDPQARIDPDKNYRLTIWDELFPVPVRLQGEQERAAQQAVAEFRRLYPNVDVQVKLWTEGTLHKELESAVQKGNPPDAAVVTGRQRYSLQLPVTRFLEDLETNGYLPETLARVFDGNDYWMWPSWSSVRVLALNRRLLGSAFAGLLESNPAGQAEEYRKFVFDFDTLLQEFSRVPLQPALFLQSETSESFMMLLAGEGVNMLSGPGSVGWTKEQLTSIAQQLSHWISKKVVRTTSGDLLDQFYRGRVPAIGPVGPWIIGKVPKHRSGIKSPQADDIALLPFPARESVGPPEPVDYGVAVFRHSRFKGPDQTRLAMEFARLYGKYMGVFYSVSRWGVPSYQPLVGLWAERLGLNPVQQAGILAACTGTPRPKLPARWQALELGLLQEVVEPAVISFLQGKTPAAELGEYLADEIEQAVAILTRQEEELQDKRKP